MCSCCRHPGRKLTHDLIQVTQCTVCNQHGCKNWFFRVFIQISGKIKTVQLNYYIYIYREREFNIFRLQCYLSYFLTSQLVNVIISSKNISQNTFKKTKNFKTSSALWMIYSLQLLNQLLGVFKMFVKVFGTSSILMSLDIQSVPCHVSQCYRQTWS